jgi:mannose-6-phosphate isomerase-like protein (cupin superfamily)
MIPIITRIRAKSLEEFGELVRHKGEEVVYVITGRIEVHTEFYDPVVIGEGELIYIDSSMGHAYLVAEGCDEALTLGVCSADDDALAQDLMSLLGENGGA